MKLLADTGVAVKNFLGLGFDIYWYGILIAGGFFLAFLLSTYLAKKRAYPEDLITDLLLLSVLGAVIGARLYYVIFAWDHFYVPGNLSATLGNIVNVRQGGLAIFGGIIGGVLLMTVYAKIKKYKVWELTDLAAASLALGQAIGRWGNFFNQEAHGALVENPSFQFFPYAVYLDHPKGSEPAGWYQATFFYESLWCLLLAGILVWVFLKARYRGQATLTYFALYGLERGCVEWLRTDQLKIGSLPVSALLSLALFAICTTVLIVLRIKGYTSPILFEEERRQSAKNNQKNKKDTGEDPDHGTESEIR